MIYEKRIYKVAENRMSELIERFEKHTIRLFEKYNIKAVLFGVSMEDKNEFFYILEFEDLNSMKESWKGFIEDEERKKIWGESNFNGKLVVDIKSIIYNKLEINKK